MVYEKDKIKLSLCMPIYNNKENVECTVRRVLRMNIPCVQIVLSDNKSTDGTRELLSSFDDNRVKIICNAHNVGAKLNWYNALRNGDGEYLYLIMGRDCICEKNIDRLLDLLSIAKRKSVGLIMDRKCRGEYEIISGIDAYIIFLRQEHPTGTIISKSFFDRIQNARIFFEKEMAYPEMYLKNKILGENAVGMIANAGVFTYMTSVNKASVVSHFENNSNLEPFFFPSRRMQQFQEIIKMTSDTLMTYEETDKIRFLSAKTRELFEEVTFGYKAWREDYENAGHYALKHSMIGSREMETYLVESRRIADYTWKEWLNSTDGVCSIYNEYLERVRGIENNIQMEFMYKCMISLMDKFITSKQKGFNFGNYLESMGIRKIVIYGYSYIGRILYNELKKSLFQLLCVIDKNCNSLYSEDSIIHPDDIDLNEVDIVVICLNDEIAADGLKNRLLEEYKKPKIVLAYELLYQTINRDR